MTELADLFDLLAMYDHQDKLALAVGSRPSKPPEEGLNPDANGSGGNSPTKLLSGQRSINRSDKTEGSR